MSFEPPRHRGTEFFIFLPTDITTDEEDEPDGYPFYPPDSSFIVHHSSFSRVTAPTATITGPTVSGLSIPVSWSGDDGAGSGVVAYTVQVQDNGGSWQDWLVGTQQTGADYQAQPEHSYHFRVKARDRVGHETAQWVVFGPVTVKAVTKYYTLGSQRVAMRQGTQVYYLHGDHLGSTSLTTDQTGQPVSQARYLPYGEELWREGSSRTDFGFTGQRSEAGFGLYDYNARFYSPYLGRFVSPDTIVPGPENPQAWNRYAYTFNNPLKYTDSSGHCPPCDSPWDPLRNLWESAPEAAPEAAEEMVVDTAESVVAAGKILSNVASRIASASPDAIVFGFSASANLGTNINLWVPGGGSIDVGMEEVVNFNTGEHTPFAYMGPGGAYGASASLTGYGGFIWNLPENSAYLGPFESMTATGGGGEAATFTYFWAPGEEPLTGAFISGNTKGFAIGYGVGAGGSISYNQTEYFQLGPVPQEISPEQGDTITPEEEEYKY